MSAFSAVGRISPHDIHDVDGQNTTKTTEQSPALSHALARVLVCDSEAIRRDHDGIQRVIKSFALRPYVIVLGQVECEFEDCMIARPFRLGRLIDAVDSALCMTPEKIHDERIDCAPYGYVDLARKLWIATAPDLPAAPDAQNSGVALTDKEILLVYALSIAQGGDVSKSMLYAYVWGYTSTLETHTLETHIYRLRQKIEPDPANPCIILTRNERYALLNYEK